MDDRDYHARRAEEESKRGLGSDLLAHFDAEAERRQTETEALLEQVIAGLAPENDEMNQALIHPHNKEDDDGRH